MTPSTESIDHGQSVFLENLLNNRENCLYLYKTIDAAADFPFPKLVDFFLRHLKLKEEDAWDVSRYFIWASNQKQDSVLRSSAISEVFRRGLTGNVLLTQSAIEYRDEQVQKGDSIMQDMRTKYPSLFQAAIENSRAVLNSDPQQNRLERAISRFIFTLRPFAEGRDALIAYVSKCIFQGISDSPVFCWSLYRSAGGDDRDELIQKNMEAMFKELTK